MEHFTDVGKIKDADIDGEFEGCGDVCIACGSDVPSDWQVCQACGMENGLGLC